MPIFILLLTPTPYSAQIKIYKVGSKLRHSTYISKYFLLILMPPRIPVLNLSLGEGREGAGVFLQVISLFQPKQEG